MLQQPGEYSRGVVDWTQQVSVGFHHSTVVHVAKETALTPHCLDATAAWRVQPGHCRLDSTGCLPL